MTEILIKPLSLSNLQKDTGCDAVKFQTFDADRLANKIPKR